MVHFTGIFANSHLQYENERNKGPEGMPSLPEMVEVAIKVLKKNSNGYFLMVSKEYAKLLLVSNLSIK